MLEALLNSPMRLTVVFPMFSVLSRFHGLYPPTHPPVSCFTLPEYPLLALNTPLGYHNYSRRGSSALNVPSPIIRQAFIHLRSRSRIPSFGQYSLSSLEFSHDSPFAFIIFLQLTLSSCIFCWAMRS